MKTLRKALLAVAFCAFIVSILIVRVSAEDKQTATYTVTESDGKYAVGELSYGTLSELLEKLPEGADVYFDDLTVSESIRISKSMTISGKLSLVSGGIVSEESEVKLDEAEITLISGSVRVKSGSLTMSNSNIAAYGDSAVVLDYNAGAVFRMASGEVLQKSSSAAILISQGSAYIQGGRVISEYAEAISNAGTLTVGACAISGYGYDVITEVPITLGEGEVLSPISVMYKRSFVKGTLTPVILSAEGGTSSISLFDEGGESFSLTYFENYSSTDEKKFLAVYLPYRVRFYSDGELYLESEVLSGDTLVAPKSPTREGYRFSGWYLDEHRSFSYSFGTTVSSDLSLYAAFSLTEPEFHISSLSFTYDGNSRTLAFDTLSHPLSNKGSFSFDWYKNGEATKISSSSLTVKNVLDSGTYFCVITFAYGGDFVNVTTPEVTVTVAKCEIATPTVADMIYDGSEKIPQINKSSEYTISVSTGIDVASYPVVFTLTDPYNCMWSTTEAPTVTVYYSILKAENLFLSYPSISQCYEGVSYSPSAAALFGEVSYLYSTSSEGPWSTDAPLIAGEYCFKAIVTGCDNYSGLESDVYPYTVLVEKCTGIRIDKAPDRTVYTAFERVSLDGAQFSATYNSGRVELLPLSVLKISYKNGNHLLVSDTAFSVSYEGVSVPVSVTVTRASYDLSEVDFSNLSVVYNGERHTASVTCEVVGLDGIPLGFNIVGGGCDVGSYSITLSFVCISPNYYCPESMQATLTVLAAPLTVSYGITEFVYDGSVKIPTAEVTLVSGLKISVLLSGEAADAGNYTATAVLDNKNYYLLNPTVSFVIKKADISLDGATWSTGCFIYNGTQQSVSVTGLPPEVSVAGYANATATEVGEYIATVTLVYDTKNYNPPPKLSCAWSIIKAEYDTSTFSFENAEFYFDGNIHYPALIGKLPVGADGSSPIYEFSGGAIHVSDGSVTVTVTFISQSNNYLSPSPMSATVRILPKRIGAIWENTLFVYDGACHIPSVFCAEAELDVLGGAIDAGEYVATAIPVSLDYELINPSVSFKINKSENRFTLTPSIFSIYTSGNLSPIGEAWYGEVVFEYYLDAALNNRVEIPSAAGSYYMSAYVPESNNCFALRSEPVPFSIVEVAPANIIATLKGSSLVAMQRITDKDIELKIVNNDGSVYTISAEEASFIYEQADSLRYHDKSVTVSYMNVSAVLPVSVARATYDTSGVRWIGTNHTYDGTEKLAYLDGLPEGVTVASYVKNSAILAGTYKLEATLIYDRENYYAPELPDAWLQINKAVVKLPSLASAVYDKQHHTPYIPESHLYKSIPITELSAGVYKVYFELTDPENYKFENEISYAEFEILPREITLKILSDGKSYSIENGEVFDGDDLMLSYYTEDGYVYAKSASTDYAVTVIPLKEEDGAVWILLLLILLCVLVILLVYILFRRRDSLEAFFVSFKARLAGISEYEVAALPAASPPAALDGVMRSVDEEHANGLISDTLAKTLITKSTELIRTTGSRRAIINIESISAAFDDGDEVDINSMKQKGLISSDAIYVKVLGGGMIDKPLSIKANAFSLSAVKMITLTGGRAVRVRSVKNKDTDFDK